MPRSYTVRRRPSARDLLFLLFALILPLAFPAAVDAQQVAAYFKQNCAACHTIGGGRLTGPDLKDVTQRKDRAWLARFIQNPQAVIDSGDAYARQLLQEARGVLMPTLPGMTPARAGELVDYIETASQGGVVQTAAPEPSDQPFTAHDRVIGRELFLGTLPLANGGPACAGCHALSTLAGLGGGMLGPDLTRVYERLGGRQAVSAWLGAPATSTMQTIFRSAPLKPEEILSLLAAIEDAAPGTASPAEPSAVFLLLGFGGMVLGLVGIQGAWRKRFLAVRRPLVCRHKRGDG